MTSQKPKIIAFGDNVVDCYEDTGRMYPGGNCVNHAVFAQRFGAEALYAGAVCDDAAGRAIRDSLLAEGVGTSLLRILPGQTAWCLISNQDGERNFVGANLGVSIIAPGPADLAAIKEADAVHTGRSSHIDAWLPLLAGMTRISYDFATIRDESRIRAVAPFCYLAGFSGGGLSRDEAGALASLAIAAGAKNAIVTRGSEGALLAGADGRITLGAAVPVVPVDTLGAGDTFIARTLVGLLRGEAADVLLAAAARAAAETCLSHGAFGHGAPLEVDLSTLQTIEEIYATTRPAPGPEAALS